MRLRLNHAIDLAASAIALPCIGAFFAAKATLAKSRNAPETRSAPKTGDDKNILLVIQTMHSYASIVESGHEEIIFQADLEGFFDHVYTLYPTIGADTGQPIESFDGPGREVSMSARHTFLEYKMAFLGLEKLPTFDFLLSQAIMLSEIEQFARDHGVSAIRGNCPFLTGLYSMILSQLLQRPYSLRIGGNYDLMHKNGMMVFKKIFRRYSVARKFANVVLRNADNICAVNENNLNYALSNGARPEKSVVVRYGNMVDKLHYGPIEGRGKALSSSDVEGRPLAVCVGRLTKIKHPEDVLTATKVAVQKIPRLLTLFVGNGDQREELERLAETMGISDNVCFLGKRNQKFLAQLYSQAHVYLSPLTGRSLVEAGLAALPLIAYDYEWHSEFVHHESTGLLVPYREPEALGEALVTLLQDEEKSRKLGANARKLALDLMDKNSILKQEQNAYTSMRW